MSLFCPFHSVLIDNRSNCLSLHSRKVNTKELFVQSIRDVPNERESDISIIQIKLPKKYREA